MISEFTGEDAEKFGGSPVNSPDCILNEQSVNNSWKNHLVGLYDTFNKQKPSRKTNGGFIDDIKKSFKNLKYEKIQNAIDLQPKIMEAIIAANGGYTNCAMDQTRRGKDAHCCRNMISKYAVIRRSCFLF